MSTGLRFVGVGSLFEAELGPARTSRLGILDRVTKTVVAASPDQRRLDNFRVLRQALGCCWSVAIAASPAAGFDRFEGWSGSADVKWIFRENLKKNRLRQADLDRIGDLTHH